MKPIRSAAYKFLEDVGITKLPLSLDDVISVIIENGWSVFSYSEAKDFFDSMSTAGKDLSTYINDRNGFTIFEDNQATIFYKDDLGYQEKIFVLCHEIGHIVLKHTYYGILGNNPSSSMTKTQEQEADHFALELNAPLPILNQLHIKSYKEICHMGLLDGSRAKQQYMEYLDSKENTSYTVSTEEEIKLCEQFQDLIKQQNHNAKKRKFRKAAFVASFTIVISVFSILAYIYLTGSNNQHPMDTAEETTTSVTNQEDQIPYIATYYWTDSGTVYHAYADCQAIKNSIDIHNGTLDEAKDEKERLCKFCESRMATDK